VGLERTAKVVESILDLGRCARWTDLKVEGVAMITIADLKGEWWWGGVGTMFSGLHEMFRIYIKMEI
jgi:hypothetical protein